MARPKSEDKRAAILSAATQAIANDGLGASTSKIARTAGVAEGTLFTYFSTKDELLNQLYIELKRDLSEEISSNFPAGCRAKDRTRHVWNSFVNWGLRHSDKRRAVAQLSVSEKISGRTKAIAGVPFAEINAMLEGRSAGGRLRGLSPGYVAAILASLAEATMDFMARDAKHADEYRTAGFDAFWSATGN